MNGKTCPLPPATCDLSIIIVNWNTRDLLAECLESVCDDQLQMIGEQTPITEIIVVDNASTDGSVGMVRDRFPSVHLRENSENIGFARANNQAIRMAMGRFILLLNSDTVVQPNALQLLIEALERYPKAGAAGPQVLNPDGTLQNCYGSLPSIFSELIGPYAFDTLTKPWGRIGGRMHKTLMPNERCKAVDRVSFACTMIRREALEQVGLLDERFEFYSEDYDYFMRLRQVGWETIFCPQSRIVHHWGASSSQRSEWSLRQLYRSKRLYSAKHQGATAETVLRFGFAVRFAIKWVIGAIRYLLGQPNAYRQMARYRLLMHDMLQTVTSVLP